MTTKVTIENWGTFFISTDKVPEILAWLQANYTHPSAIGEVTVNNTGSQLING